MRVDDIEDREDWKRNEQRGKKHVGAEILWKCLCVADAKKTRLKQGLESDFSREARQETQVLWGEGWGIHSHGTHPNVRSPKALLKTFSKSTFFFLLPPLPFSVTKPGSALRSTSTAHSILWLVCSSVEPGFGPRALSETYRVSHL